MCVIVCHNDNDGNDTEPNRTYVNSGIGSNDDDDDDQRQHDCCDDHCDRVNHLIDSNTVTITNQRIGSMIMSGL